MRNTPAITQLRAAAIEIDGLMWVRASAAIRIIGLGPAWYQALPARHGVIQFRQIVPVSRGASKGTIIWWSLEGLICFVGHRIKSRSHRPWTQREDTRLIALLADHSIDDAARAMKRSGKSVLDRIQRLSNLRSIWRDHHRLITSGQLMRLTRKRSYATIQRWRNLGLKCIRTASGRSDTLFRLEDARQFFIDHPNLLITLHPDSRRLLRLTMADIEGRAA